ncbi:MAG: phosphoglycerate kinase [Rhodobiaceae bacterium]|nr:phosphoglycerate kinase [Rhodobiaceae bacterium]MCC0013121.1 phosphoglycerate kinase [Rhodobiaceae bacterium]MCC0018511.1 phosphoglycerate kinase [Rhodobiaceae bacterium]
MGAFRTLDDLDLMGKIVLTRVDINVPVKDGHVTDATRIERIVPTLKDIQAKGGKPVLLAHFGRPKGQYVPEMSLRLTVPALEAALGQPVVFIEKPDRAALEATPAGSIVLIENTRFAPGEEKNDPGMAKFLASLGDVFCNDAFSAAHRAHASTEGVAHLLPSCAGRLMQAELEALEKALTTPERPVLAIVGGAKVSTKIDLLENLSGKVDMLAIGGAMANTFLAAQGHSLGKSLMEPDLLDLAMRIEQAARDKGCELLLPKDLVVAKEFKAGADSRACGLDDAGDDEMALDIGPETVADLVARLDGVRTVVWNGPFGAFEIPPFDTGTNAVAAKVAELTRAGKLTSIAGGGDTVAALNTAGVSEDFSYISTAGGAFLEWLEGKSLPGVEVLRT